MKKSKKTAILISLSLLLMTPFLTYSQKSIVTNTNPKGYGLLAEKYKKYGYIDSSGKEIIPAIYDFVRLSKKYNWIIVGNRIEGDFNKYLYGIIDLAGHVIVPVIYNQIDEHPNNEAIIVVVKDEKYGCIDILGKEIIPAIYDYILPHKEYNWIVVTNRLKENPNKHLYEIMDLKGDVIAPLIYDKIYITKKSKDIITVVEDGKYGCINRKGKLCIPTIYTNMIQHNYDVAIGDGLIAVKKEDKWGYIDLEGVVKIPFIYNHVNVFYKGLAKITKGFKRGIIDIDGKEVVAPVYSSIEAFNDVGFAFVSKNQKSFNSSSRIRK